MQSDLSIDLHSEHHGFYFYLTQNIQTFVTRTPLNPLLSFLLKDNKPKNAGLGFLKHHQIHTARKQPMPAAQRDLSRSIWHIETDLQLMLLLLRKRVFPERHFSRKKILRRLRLYILQKYYKDQGSENLKGLTSSNNHTPLAQWVYESMCWALPRLSIRNFFVTLYYF